MGNACNDQKKDGRKHLEGHTQLQDLLALVTCGSSVRNAPFCTGTTCRAPAPNTRFSDTQTPTTPSSTPKRSPQLRQLLGFIY